MNNIKEQYGNGLLFAKMNTPASSTLTVRTPIAASEQLGDDTGDDGRRRHAGNSEADRHGHADAAVATRDAADAVAPNVFRES